MAERLNFRDRRLVRSYMRPGLIIALVIIVVSIIISYFIVYFKPELEEIANQILMGGIILAVVIMWLMNRKYIKDLSKGNKIIERWPLIEKKKLDDTLIFTINNKDFIVENEIWESASEGDEIEIHYSCKSRIMLELRLKEKSISNYY